MQKLKSDETLAIEAFIDALENLRYQRQAQWQGKRHPAGKRFSQEEIATEIYGAYRNLLTGRSQRLPQRQTILEIADYLEASPKERNQLLVAARYLPEEERLMGEDLILNRQLMDEIFAQLSIPAMILSPELEVKDINQLFKAIFGLEEVPPATNVIELYFDKRFPIAAQMEGMNKAYIIKTYLENPRSILPHSDWYRSLLKQAQSYISQLSNQGFATDNSLALPNAKGEIYHLRCLQLTGTPGYSPMIFGCQADDEAAERRLQEARSSALDYQAH